MLMSHKDDIEKALGASLVWSAVMISSHQRFLISLMDVSIENETDWLQMARFHAEWSKKFYDVIVPYLGIMLGLDGEIWNSNLVELYWPIRSQCSFIMWI